MTTEVLKQALEFVTSEYWDTALYINMRVSDDASKLAKALRDALAQADQSVVVPRGWRLVQKSPREVAAELYAQHPTYSGKKPLAWRDAPKEVQREWINKATDMLAASPSHAPAVQDDGAAIREHNATIPAAMYPADQRPEERFARQVIAAYPDHALQGAEKPETHPDLPECKHNAHGWEPETQGERAELIRLAQVAIHECPGHLSQDWQVAAIRVCKGLPALLSAGPARVEPLTDALESISRIVIERGMDAEEAIERGMAAIGYAQRALAAHGIGKDQAS